jgi:hypothetical protein
MDEKERDIYFNHLTSRASGARTVSSPTPTETTKNATAESVKRPCGTGTFRALEKVETKTDQK